MSNVKPGYLLKVTTWENDADNYKTIEWHSENKDEISFMISVAELFKSQYRGGRYGNAEVPSYDDEDAEIFQDIKALVDAQYESGKRVPEEFRYYEGQADISDTLHEFIEAWGEGEYWRVVEKIEVLYIPVEIADVTELFV